MLKSNTDFISTIINKCADYIVKCEEKVEYHTENALAANQWNNFLNTTTIIMGAMNIFTLSLLTVFEASTLAVTVVSGSFSLVLMLSQNIKDAYSFKSLGHLHYSSADSFSELKQSFQTLLDTIERHKFNESDFDALVIRYEGVLQKSHHQSIKKCKIFCCFK